MIWKRIFGSPARNDAPMALYGAAVRQARTPAFYLDGGVPDTVEGRFEMVAVHACLVLRRLREGGPEGKETGQKVFDLLFDDLDQTLREMGVGDLSVGKKIKALASSFYGRMQAYDQGFKDEEGDTLAAAILRNVFGGAEEAVHQAAALAAYMRRAEKALQEQELADVIAGRIEFNVPFEAPPISELSEAR